MKATSRQRVRFGIRKRVRVVVKATIWFRIKVRFWCGVRKSVTKSAFVIQTRPFCAM